MKKLVISLVCFSILLNSISMGIFLFYFSPTFTGRASVGTSGSIRIVISPGEIVIHSPENRTYEFDDSPYLIDLNVSDNFNADLWSYTLEDLRHGVVANESIGFTPNTTLHAVRWGNKLTVRGENTNTGKVDNKSVIFYVSVPNSAPLLSDNIDDEILVCEDSELSYYFNATDIDEDDLTFSISPLDPFFVSAPTRLNLTSMTAQIFSGRLSKGDVGLYESILSAHDSEFVDTKNINLSVIEINHVPDVSDIGVQTIYSRGDNSTFEYQLEINDIEDGSDEGSDNFTYNLTFLSGIEFLDINLSGFIYGSGNSSLVGMHNISLCVSDSGLENPHQNISYCGQDGGSLDSCQNFSVTVTNENRVPTITDYSPEDLNLEASTSSNLVGSEIVVSGSSLTVRFNITKYDPDGTIPDAYWYVDGSLEEVDSGSNIDKFNITSSSCSTVTRTVDVEITDGLANDSLQWNVTMIPVTGCPSGAPSAGGGGGGGPVIQCRPKWGCNSWNLCVNLKDALEAGIVTREDYRTVKTECDFFGFNDATCGYQTRSCNDINFCNSTAGMPDTLSHCYYTENPSCTDGIRNCHGGDCELNVDCGGPCAPCPTCSDDVQNQGEFGVDCGGPCPNDCPVETPQKDYTFIALILIVILLLLIVIAILKIRSVYVLRKKVSSYGNIQ